MSRLCRYLILIPDHTYIKMWRYILSFVLTLIYLDLVSSGVRGYEWSQVVPN